MKDAEIVNIEESNNKICLPRKMGSSPAAECSRHSASSLYFSWSELECFQPCQCHCLRTNSSFDFILYVHPSRFLKFSAHLPLPLVFLAIILVTPLSANTATSSSCWKGENANPALPLESLKGSSSSLVYGGRQVVHCGWGWLTGEAAATKYHRLGDLQTTEI